MKLYFLETHQGCGIRKAKDVYEAEKQALKEVGYSNFKNIREATKDDIEWVRAMGGHIPTV